MSDLAAADAEHAPASGDVRQVAVSISTSVALAAAVAILEAIEIFSGVVGLGHGLLPVVVG
ncbi:MAG: hypothetical protein ACO3N1_08860 [Ilumatobacteraceae bacterium]